MDILTQNMSEKRKLKLKKRMAQGKTYELSNYSLESLVFRKDGSVILTGERFYITQTTTTNANGVSSTRTYYHFDDIIAICFDKNGSVLWETEIPKSQTSSATGGLGFSCSFAQISSGGNEYFIFNDHPKNMFGGKKGRQYTFLGRKETLVVIVKIDSDGKQTKDALFNSKDEGIMCKPTVTQKISDTEFAIFGQRKKSQKFAKIKFRK